MKMDSQIIEEARKLYQDIPYHNFKHALDVIKEASAIVSRCETEGRAVDKEVVFYATLFHDAGFGKDHKKEGYETKEEYAASLAKKTLLKNGFSEEFTKFVKKVILATTQQGKFEGDEEKILRSADLASIASDYSNFLKNNLLLKKEAEIMSGRKISNKDWKKRTKETIEFYLTQDIRLTNHYLDKNGESMFHGKAKENLDRFLKEF